MRSINGTTFLSFLMKLLLFTTGWTVIGLSHQYFTDKVPSRWHNVLTRPSCIQFINRWKLTWRAVLFICGRVRKGMKRLSIRHGTTLLY